MANNGEASVEEILESIKRVMERDSRDSAAQVARRRVEEAEEADARAVARDKEPAADLEAEGEREEILDLAEMELDEVVEIDDDDGDSDTPLIADEVRGAMQENLAALAMLSEPPAKPQIVRSGETSLEGLTRELLRPMLAEWLDKNLPGMVEKMVQAEIARIAGKRS
ncbi:MAG: DUF2497 domain-containing protein [Erythrobacter sp.]